MRIATALDYLVFLPGLAMSAETQSPDAKVNGLIRSIHAEFLKLKELPIHFQSQEMTSDLD